MKPYTFKRGALIEEIRMTPKLRINMTKKPTLEKLLSENDARIRLQKSQLDQNIGTKLDLNDSTDIFIFTDAYVLLPHDKHMRAPSKQKRGYSRKWFRPEFLLKYDKELNTGSYDKTGSKKSEHYEIEIGAAHTALVDRMMPALINELERLKVFPINSTNLESHFHRNGINLRYLGEVASKISIPYIKELCICSMISRSCKKIFFKEMTALTFELADTPLKRSNLEQFTESERIRWMQLFEKQQAQVAIRMLNLVFGVSEDSYIYWHDHLAPQIYYDFGYELHPKPNNEDIPKGYLLETICLVTGIALKSRIYNKIDENVAHPFTIDDFLRFSRSLKTFKLNSHKLIEFTDLYHEHKQRDNMTSAIFLLNIRINIAEQLGDENEYLSYLAEKIQILLEMHEFKKAANLLSQCIQGQAPMSTGSIKFLLLQMKLYLAENKIEKGSEVFGILKDIIQYLYGDSSPLYITLYSVWA